MYGGMPRFPANPAECAVEWMHSEDPLFLLYTSGSTGKPKGVLHSTGQLVMLAARQLQPDVRINIYLHILQSDTMSNKTAPASLQSAMGAHNFEQSKLAKGLLGRQQLR